MAAPSRCLPITKGALLSTRRVLVVVVMGVLACLQAWMPACAMAEPSSESRIKAGIVYNLALVVSWPDSLPQGSLFGIGMIGHDDAEPFLASLAAKTVRGRGLALREQPTGQALDEIRIAYISRSQATVLPALLATLASRPVLTVSEMDGFCEQGGMVQMRRERNRVQLRVNREAAEKAGLRLSSQLLKVAEIVGGGD